MMQGIRSRIWQLKNIVQDIQSRHPQVRAIYLFGSRAHRTGSRRSDLDLLILIDDLIPTRDVTDWLHDRYPIVDFFQTLDLTTATSCINGSVIRAESGALPRILGAHELWNRRDGLNTQFPDWEQISDERVSFAMTVIPPVLPKDYQKVISDYARIMAEDGYPDTLLGYDWPSIGLRLGNIVERSLLLRSRLGKKAQNVKPSIDIQSEYDFQNLIHIVLGPWLPRLESEVVTIRFNGQDKKADFHIGDSRIVIEAKIVHDANTLADVTKQLEGLRHFYQDNANVRLMLFWIAFRDIRFDTGRLESTYSDDRSQPVVLVKCINVEPVV